VFRRSTTRHSPPPRSRCRSSWISPRHPLTSSHRGFTHLKFPTLGEIAQDDYLRTVWELGAGDSSQNTSQVEATELSLDHVHKTHELLLLSTTPEEGFEACLSGE
jgi:hypothetical protein